VFTPLKLRRTTLPNRIVRAATFENMADTEGIPTAKFAELYKQLAAGGARCIITGFNHTSREGRAMQPFQAGIDDSRKIDGWKQVIDCVKSAPWKYTKDLLKKWDYGRKTPLYRKMGIYKNQ